MPCSSNAHITDIEYTSPTTQTEDLLLQDRANTGHENGDFQNTHACLNAPRHLSPNNAHMMKSDNVHQCPRKPKMLLSTFSSAASVQKLIGHSAPGPSNRPEALHLRRRAQREGVESVDAHGLLFQSQQMVTRAILTWRSRLTISPNPLNQNPTTTTAYVKMSVLPLK
jgi:hypothetical protein